MEALFSFLLKIVLMIIFAIFEAVIDFCPPLVFFLGATCLFTLNGSLPKIGGILLILIGIVTLILWINCEL